MFSIFTNIIFGSLCIQVRQRKLIKDLHSINDYLDHINAKLENHKLHKCVIQSWRSYIKLNKKIISISHMIVEYNRFFSRLISIIFPTFIMAQAYIYYVLLFLDKVPTDQKPHFLMACFEVNVFLFTIIWQCSNVVSYNKDIEKKNKNFYFSFLRLNGFKYIPLANMIKVSLI